MTLTREEQKSVLRMVIESHQGVTLSEAKTNQDIREEMKLNLEFYNALKENNKGQINEVAGAFGAFLDILGNIKDFMTGADELAGKGTSKVSKIIQAVAKWLGEKIDKYILKYIPQNIKDAGAKVASWVAWLTKWVSDTLSYKTLAKIFAMIRYRTFKPTDEQKECMLPAAKEIFRWIVITLVIAFVAKIIVILGPVVFATAKATAAVSTKTIGAIQTAGFNAKNLALLSAALAPIKAFLIKLGYKGAASKIFGAYSASEKHKKQEKLNKELEAYKAELKGNVFQKIGGLWKYCPLPQK